MRWKWFGVVAVLAALGSTVLFVVWSARTQPSTTETLTIADGHQITSALLYIALDKHYMADEGLEVRVQPYATGKAALAAVLEHQADIATTAEVPFIGALLQGQAVQMFATIQTTDKDIAILARTDAGITVPQDLAGKRIGMIPGTSSAYFLDVFLTLQGLTRSDVTVVPCEPDEATAALVTGSIDALSAWTTVRLQVQAQLLNRTTSFFGGGVYTEAWTLATWKAFLRERSEAVQKLLRALLKAERFATMHRPRAMDIVARRLDIDRGTVEQLWDNFGFAVSLDQALLVNMEGQIRTMRPAAPPASVPNLLHALYLDGLLAVAPQRVTVLH